MQVPELAILNRLFFADASHLIIYVTGLLTHADIVSSSPPDMRERNGQGCCPAFPLTISTY